MTKVKKKPNKVNLGHTTNVQNAIQGTFKGKGSTLSNDKGTIIISERKKPYSKPKYYLLYIAKRQKKRHFISSLYPLSDDLYKLDYGGRDYVLKVGTETIEIEPKR